MKRPANPSAANLENQAGYAHTPIFKWFGFAGGSISACMFNARNIEDDESYFFYGIDLFKNCLMDRVYPGVVHVPA